jgi:hypothetical protein
MRSLLGHVCLCKTVAAPTEFTGGLGDRRGTGLVLTPQRRLAHSNGRTFAHSSHHFFLHCLIVELGQLP